MCFYFVGQELANADKFGVNVLVKFLYWTGCVMYNNRVTAMGTVKKYNAEYSTSEIGCQRASLKFFTTSLPPFGCESI